MIHDDVPKMSASQIKDLVLKLVEMNYENRGQKDPVNLCVWGMPGIGKTQNLTALEGAEIEIQSGEGEDAQTEKKKVQIKILSLAEANEIGDVTGMPDKHGDRAVMLPYDFIPLEEGPGIFIIDDFNRAREEILNGIMNLVQNTRTSYWEMGPGWTIVLTANPAKAEFNVAAVDVAQITRMIQVQEIYNSDDWMNWALKTGVYAPIVAFAKTESAAFYTEGGKCIRTTPRSWTYAAQLLKFMDPEERGIAPGGLTKEYTRKMVQAAVDKASADAFISFLNTKSEYLVNPKDFFVDYGKAMSTLKKAAQEGLDSMVYITYFRLAGYLSTEQFKAKQTSKQLQIAIDAFLEGRKDLGLRRDQVKACLSSVMKGNPILAASMGQNSNFQSIFTSADLVVPGVTDEEEVESRPRRGRQISSN